MEDVLLIFQNKYIYIPFLTWFAIQLFKLIYDMVTTKNFNFRRILGAGGMPSSHSAIVMAISTMVGKNYGVDSALFAVSLIFSCVVMYDAAGVRRAAGKQATLLNKIVDTPGLSGLQVKEKLVELLGHTPFQVWVGAVIGIVVGAFLG